MMDANVVRWKVTRLPVFGPLFVFEDLGFNGTHVATRWKGYSARLIFDARRIDCSFDFDKSRGIIELFR